MRWGLQMRTLLMVFVAMALTGCGDDIETDPSVLLPVAAEARKACDGHYSSMYSGVDASVACADYAQIASCIDGNRDDCPLKGHGAF